MSTDEELRFSIRADVPKENIQALDNVLNELFGTLSSKMKEAGEFLDSVKMRPPRNSLEDTGAEREIEEEETDSDMPDLVSESEVDSESEVENSDSDNDADDESESEIDHIFLILIDGQVIGYSTTLRSAMQAMDELYGEYTANNQGSFRLERTPTSLRIYRRTPYVWFMFSEQIALQIDIQVVAKV